MINIDTASTIGAKLWAGRPNPWDFFTEILAEQWDSLGDRVVATHPEVENARQLSDAHGVLDVENDLLALAQNRPELRNDPYFVVFLASTITYPRAANFDRFPNRQDEFRGMFSDTASMVNDRVDFDALRGLAAGASVVAILFLSNFDDMQRRVYEKEVQLRAQGDFD